MKRAILILCILLMGGCASLDELNPYFKVGGAVQINDQTDQLLRTTYKDQCDKNFKAIFGPGVEWRGRHELELIHESWYLCGAPFNKHPEMYSLDLRYMYKIGGQK